MQRARVARGALYITVQNVALYMIPLAFYAALARILTQSETGEIPIFYLVMAVFTTITQLAVPVAATKFISENIGSGRAATASASARTALKLILAISIPSALIGVIVSPWLSATVFGTPSEALLLQVVVATSLLLNLTTLIGACFMGLGLFGSVAIQNLVFFGTSRGLGVILAWIGYRLTGVVAGFLLGSVACLALSLALLRGKLPLANEKFPPRTLLAYSYPVWITMIVNIGQSWADSAILYALTSSLATLGVYYLISTGATVISVLWTPVTTTMFPAMSAEYGKTGVQGIVNSFRRSTRVLNLTVIPLSLSLAAVSRTAISVAYGPAYVIGAVPFVILTLATIMAAYSMLFSTALQAVGETKAMMKIGVVSVAVELLLTALLARPLSATGAALARTAMFIVGVVLGYRVLSGKVRIAVDTGSIVRAAIFGAILATPLLAAEWVLTDVAPQPLPLILGVEGFLFLAVGLIVVKKWKPIEAQDLELIKEALPRSLHKALDWLVSSSAEDQNGVEK